MKGGDKVLLISCAAEHEDDFLECEWCGRIGSTMLVRTVLPLNRYDVQVEDAAGAVWHVKNRHLVLVETFEQRNQH